MTGVSEMSDTVIKHKAVVVLNEYRHGFATEDILKFSAKLVTPNKHFADVMPLPHPTCLGHLLDIMGSQLPVSSFYSDCNGKSEVCGSLVA